MTTHQHTARDEQFGRLYEYDDRFVVSLDLPYDDDRVDVDVVGTTAIVVVDDGPDALEAEFDLPGEAETVDMNNGVLTITIPK